LHLTECLKGILCSLALAEISVAFATAHESAISKPITSLLVRTHSLPDFDFTASTPALISGCCMCVIGAAVRSHCYRTLGRLFTFELSIRQDHKLVTSGIYSIVRHPGYTGAWGFCLGIMLCHLHPRSWLVSCSGLFPPSGQAVKWSIACSWAALSTILYTALEGRIRREEVMLEKHFGEERRRYRKKVPYKLVPWLY